jgi:hypothetical protein
VPEVIAMGQLRVIAAWLLFAATGAGVLIVLGRVVDRLVGRFAAWRGRSGSEE